MLNKQLKIIAFVLTVALISGCSTARRAALPPAEIPLVQEQINKNEQVKNQMSPEADTLSLSEAISRALEYNKELKVFKTEIEAREARTLQESLLPNPELGFEIENFGGNGSLKGIQGSEATLSIGQLVELGGKRSKRTTVAALESDIAFLQYEIKRLNVITQVRSTFTQMLFAQEKIKLDQKLLKLSQSFKSSIDTLVSAGRLSNAESARAQVELSNRKLALKRSLRELNNARRKMSATWGMSQADFSAVNGNLVFSQKIPDSNLLLHALEKSPLLIEQEATIKRQKAETELAKAFAIPDPMISAGYRRFQETDDQAFVADLSIPLPIFNSNQGGQQEAQVRERQGEQKLQALSNQIQTEVNNRLETINNLSSETENIRNVIIPEAQKAYDIIYQNYRLGKYALIDILDAQRQLFVAEDRYLNVLAEVNLQVIELEELLGQSINSL